MKDFFSRLFSSLFGTNRAWWIEIKTAAPICTYYFGPFDTEQEAMLAKKGYLEDLQQEGSKVTASTIMPLSEPPQQLTVYEENMDSAAPDPKPAFSGQV